MIVIGHELVIFILVMFIFAVHDVRVEFGVIIEFQLMVVLLIGPPAIKHRVMVMVEVTLGVRRSLPV